MTSGHVRPLRRKRAPLSLILTAILIWTCAVVLAVFMWWIAAAVAAFCGTTVVAVTVYGVLRGRRHELHARREDKA